MTLNIQSRFFTLHDGRVYGGRWPNIKCGINVFTLIDHYIIERILNEKFPFAANTEVT